MARVVRARLTSPARRVGQTELVSSRSRFGSAAGPFAAFRRLSPPQRQWEVFWGCRSHAHPPSRVCAVAAPSSLVIFTGSRPEDGEFGNTRLAQRASRGSVCADAGLSVERRRSMPVDGFPPLLSAPVGRLNAEQRAVERLCSSSAISHRRPVNRKNSWQGAYERAVAQARSAAPSLLVNSQAGGDGRERILVLPFASA
jgi:hypothetical protein